MSARRATARASERTAKRDETSELLDPAEEVAAVVGVDFANTFGSTPMAAVTPSSLAKNCFRDGWWVTGSGGIGPKSLPKQGVGILDVNQIFGGKSPMPSN